MSISDIVGDLTKHFWIGRSPCIVKAIDSLRSGDTVEAMVALAEEITRQKKMSAIYNLHILAKAIGDIERVERKKHV